MKVGVRGISEIGMFKEDKIHLEVAIVIVHGIMDTSRGHGLQNQVRSGI